MKKYIQGAKAEFTIQLLVKDSNGVSRPFDLTGNTEITMKWKTGTTIITKNKVASPIGVEVLGAVTEGKIKGTLLPADTLTQSQTGAGLIEIAVSFSATDIKKFQIKNGFAVDDDVA